MSSLMKDLLELAAENSPRNRVELLKRITDVYLDQPDEHSPAGQYLLEEIITKLIDKISGPDRAEAAASLSRLPEMPATVARTLATDSDIEVAGPIVRNYSGLSEEVLVDVAKTASQDHLHAIANRPTVTPPVADVVVTRGDPNVVRALAANSGAQFTNGGLRTLIDKARSDVDLQALIVERADLSLDAIGKLLPIISAELSARLRGAVDFDEAVVSEHLAEWMEDRKNNIARVAGYIDAIAKDDLKLANVAMELIRSRRLLDAATVLAAMVDLDRYYAFNILTRGNLQTALLLLRSLELSWTVADAFVKLRQKKMGLRSREIMPRAGDYEAMDIDAARRVIRFLKVRLTAGAATKAAVATPAPAQRAG